MEEYEYRKNYGGGKVPQTCKTCELNFDGKCAGSVSAFNPPYKYGEKITDDSKTCRSWGISYDEYCKTTAAY